MSLPLKAPESGEPQAALNNSPRCGCPERCPQCHILPFFSQAAPCHPSWLRPILSLMFTQCWELGRLQAWGKAFREAPFTLSSLCGSQTYPIRGMHWSGLAQFRRRPWPIPLTCAGQAKVVFTQQAADTDQCKNSMSSRAPALEPVRAGSFPP